MRALVWVVRGFIFLFLFAFAIKNTDPVSVQLFLDAAWHAPLVIVVLVFFAAGAFFGAISLLGTIFSLRQEISTLRRELNATKTEVRVVAPPRT
ncbi:MAG: LapA family protein [Betaproteobacteria bacterium]|uniref:LapA family protein n=1 Tax=Candidatus Proximibacter danicus TaxID=2954365 RepID=A0A9D7K199_9PROT|nr:LapA family protein [Candidatus Proximibacter danicus]MBK9446594.1 LapA family protein [Betaproteobacteria bacterium]